MSQLNDKYPRVSVALATYNGANYLPQLLDSLDQQTLRPTEIIVCDDGSTDQTLAVLEDYGRRLPITILTNGQPLGVVRNFQKAVAHCQGDYIAFCDQDDVWLPQKLACSAQLLNDIDGPQPAMVFTDLRVVDENLDLIANSYWQHRKLAPAKETFASLIYGNFVTGCTMLINRPMAIEVARMPNTVLMHDFWISCVAYGIGQCRFVSEPTILYRQHTTNVTTNDVVTMRTRWKRLITLLTNNQEAAQFLMPEIGQAREFIRLYDGQLTPLNKKALNQLFELEKRSPFFRKWRTFMIKFLHIF